MNGRKIKGRIIEKYGTIKNFANALGCTHQTVDNILSERSDMTISKASKWMKVLDIPANEFNAYFF